MVFYTHSLKHFTFLVLCRRFFSEIHGKFKWIGTKLGKIDELQKFAVFASMLFFTFKTNLSAVKLAVLARSAYVPFPGSCLFQYR
jgi:hypothetical protein